MVAWPGKVGPKISPSVQISEIRRSIFILYAAYIWWLQQTKNSQPHQHLQQEQQRAQESNASFICIQTWHFGSEDCLQSFYLSESLTAFFVYLCSMPKRVKEDANSAERAIAGKHKAARINVPICGCLCARPGELLHVDTLRPDFTIRCRCMHCGPNGRCTVMLNDVGAFWSYFLTGNILCESCRE